MMRSMFSGVSSLRVHQTRMDVIANNIANVNTEGFKAQRATFADAFYQNIQGASGPDPVFGRSGTNPRQVGLGLNLASIDNLMHQGIARRTDNALDVAIEGGGFFVVQDRGGANLFTRAGRIERDAHWNLHIGGNMLMGWSTITDPNTPGGHAVARGILRPLSLGGEKQNMPSEPTTMVNIVGNLNTEQLSYDQATNRHYRIVPKTIYDSLGNAYMINIRFVYHRNFSTASDSPHGYWTMELMTVEFDPATGQPPLPGATAPPVTPAGSPVGLNGFPLGVRAYIEGDHTRPSFIGVCLFQGKAMAGQGIDEFRGGMITTATVAFDSNGNMIGIGRATATGEPIGFLHSTRVNEWGRAAVGGGAAGSPAPTADNAWRRGREFNFQIVPIAGVAPSATFGETPLGHPASDYSPGPPPANAPPRDHTRVAVGNLTVNFAELGQRGQENTTIRALTMNGGGPGVLTDISLSGDGTIMGRYSNGRDRILGQIPLAFFSNPAGLERVGNSFWRTTANSGAFDGVGLVGQMIGGALEGSNVDLSSEFTEMITTQRGFQAASRTITVSDEMLQELVNLRR